MRTDLRDRYFDLHTRPVAPDEAAAFSAEVDAVADEPLVCLDGLGLAAWPTRSHKLLRFVDVARLPEEVRAAFARPLAQLPLLAAVFVDPSELSFRTFENIIGLEGYFAGCGLDELQIEAPASQGALTLARLVVPERLRERLLSLDASGLYAPPLNAGSRGGQRFIFHSAELAQALTRAVRGALAEALDLSSFVHVNPVFRCNRFEPGDRPFTRHVDTPYVHAALQQVSRYTLLLYLTGGEGQPVLDLEGGTCLHHVGPLSVVVFDQALEHEGRPFVDGRKVFLRTELIVQAPKVTAVPALGALFAQATYLTGESVFRPELEAHAKQAYDLAARGHWRRLSDLPAPVWLHKTFRGLSFVSNGYDVFVRQDALSLREAATLAMLDVLNASIDGAPLRAACRTRVLKDGQSPTAALAESARTDMAPVVEVPKVLLAPAGAEEPGLRCCLFHFERGFEASRSADVTELYRGIARQTRRALRNAPVMLMGEQVLLDATRFVVDGDKVHILSERALAPVNFAACWNIGEDSDYIDIEARLQALQHVVPPILFGEEDGCWHLRLDLFRNDWMVSAEEEEVAVPAIRDLGYLRAEALMESRDQEEMAIVDAWSEVERQPRRVAKGWFEHTSPVLEDVDV
jgi:hypothetical protein